MAPASATAPANRQRASLTRPVAIIASLGLHGVLLYAASRAPWPTPATGEGPPIVWLEARAVLPPPDSRAVPLPEPPAADPPQADETPETTPTQLPETLPEPEMPPASEPPAPVEEPSRPPAPPQPAATREPANPPRIDWDKERRRAITSVLEDRERAGNYRSFSLDDIEQPEPQRIEPAPKPMVTDNCVVATNRFARMAAMMIGRCVREPNGDLFAAARPMYLDLKPVCRETRPDSPGAVTSDGRVLSTVKCELVAEEEGATDLPLDVPP